MPINRQILNKAIGILNDIRVLHSRESNRKENPVPEVMLVGIPTYPPCML